LTENPVVIDDDEDGDPTDRSNHTSHQMTVNDPEVGGENTDGDAGGAAHTGGVVANSDLDDAAMLLGDEWQLRPSVQGDSIANPPGKRSRSLGGSGRADGRNNDWVFDVFAEGDSGTEGDGSPSSKRARSSSRPTEAVQNKPPPAAEKGVQMPASAHGD
jgi:hypothetical protein